MNASRCACVYVHMWCVCVCACMRVSEHTEREMRFFCKEAVFLSSLRVRCGFRLRLVSSASHETPWRVSSRQTVTLRHTVTFSFIAVCVWLLLFARTFPLWGAWLFSPSIFPVLSWIYLVYFPSPSLSSFSLPLFLSLSFHSRDILTTPDAFCFGAILSAALKRLLSGLVPVILPSLGS